MGHISIIVNIQIISTRLIEIDRKIGNKMQRSVYFSVSINYLFMINIIKFSIG